jgi:uroporphyrinogen decarboxylase
MYAEFVLPATRALVQWADTQGVRDVPLIIGGNTTPIAAQLVQTGANNLLCDFTADFDTWAGLCRQHRRAFRRNLPPHLLESGTPDEIYAAAAKELRRGRDIPGFIMGTAVVPYGTPTANQLAIRQACRDAGPRPARAEARFTP